MYLSKDRLVHLFVGIIFLILIISLFEKSRRDFLFIRLIGISSLGTWIPDLDLLIGGIGFHRSPLFHSVLPVVILSWICWRFSKSTVPVGLSIGVASHLLWDIVFYGDVRWIKGGNNDRLFLLINAIILIWYSSFRLKRWKFS